MEHDVRTPCTSPMYVTHGRLSEGGISSYENPVPPCRAMPTCRWGVWEGTDPSAYQKEGTRSSAKRHARREIWISAESKKKKQSRRHAGRPPYTTSGRTGLQPRLFPTSPSPPPHHIQD